MEYKRFTVGGTPFPNDKSNKNAEYTENEEPCNKIKGETAVSESGGKEGSESLNACKTKGKDNAAEKASSAGFQPQPLKSDEYAHMHEAVTPSCTPLSPQQARYASSSFGSASEIKIKSDYRIGKAERGGKKPKKIIARITCVFSAAAAVCAIAIAPIPKPVEKPLKLLSQYLTGKAEAALLYSADAEKKDSAENKSKSDFAESSIISAEESIVSQQSVPAAEAPKIDLSAGGFTKISNETQYKISVADLMNEAYPVGSITVFDTVNGNEDNEVEVFAEKSAYNEPEVLIIHTHGTEGYSDTASNNYRSQNTESNVVSVGNKLALELTERGISVIHCEEMFDSESYIKAYGNSFSAVSEYLSEYPTIKYIIDLHRDAIPAPSGGYAKLSSLINGTECAQLMMVVGTDEAGAVHPNWKNNLRTVLGIQSAVSEKYPGLMRPVNLRRASFNQQLSPGYFILEAGNCGNSAEEVMNSMPLFAECFCNTAISLNG